MRSTTAITYGVTGQLLSLRVPNGKPTSATFTVLRQYSTDESVPEFSGTATVDTVDTAITVAAGPAQADPQLVTVPVAGIVSGRRYLLANNAVQEWIDVVEVGPTFVRARFPLQRDFAIGATLKGCYLSAAVDATFVQSLNKLSDLYDTTPDYRVLWRIVVGAATIVVYTFFDVVRTSMTARHVDISDVNERAFGLVDSMPIEYRSEDGRPLIDSANRAVRADLIQQQIAPDSWRDDEAYDELVVRKTLVHLAAGGWRPIGWKDSQAEYSKLVNDGYDRYFEQHVVTLKHKTSVGVEASINPWQPPLPRDMWSK